MAVEGIPIDSTPVGAYLTTDEARELAATLPGMTAFLAADDGTQSMLLLLASIDVDAAGPYQGRKYNLVPSAQVREFPRVPYDSGAPQFPVRPWPYNLAQETVAIWDWDPTANAGAGGAVAPDEVKIATLYQAAWLRDGKHAARIESIRSGLSQRQIGTASETFAASALESFDGLCDRASRLMAGYRLKGGKLL